MAGEAGKPGAVNSRTPGLGAGLLGLQKEAQGSMPTVNFTAIRPPGAVAVRR